MAESRGLLARFWAMLSRKPREPQDRDDARTPIKELVKNYEQDLKEIDIESLLDEISGLIAKNQIGQLKIQKDITKIRLIVQDEIKKAEKIEHAMMRVMALRRISVKQKRLKRLEKIIVIYHDNIDLHYSLSDRLDEARISGLKKITENQLSDLALDYHEQIRDHDELISSAKGLLNSSLSEYEPELEILSKELEILGFEKEKK